MPPVSYPILSYPILSYPILYYPILYYAAGHVEKDVDRVADGAGGRVARRSARSREDWRSAAESVLYQVSSVPALFYSPVDETHDEAPDYYDIIADPMDLSTLEKLVKRTASRATSDSTPMATREDFAKGLMRVWYNAMKYNDNPEHAVHRFAKVFADVSRASHAYHGFLVPEDGAVMVERRSRKDGDSAQNSNMSRGKQRRKQRRKLSEVAEAETQGYEVLQISGKIEKADGEVQFLVEWKGFSKAESSWEPEENLKDATATVEEFKRKTAGNTVCGKHVGYTLVPCWDCVGVCNGELEDLSQYGVVYGLGPK